jgi:hypothetical protein
MMATWWMLVCESIGFPAGPGPEAMVTVALTSVCRSSITAGVFPVKTAGAGAQRELWIVCKGCRYLRPDHRGTLVASASAGDSGPAAAFRKNWRRSP